MDERENTMKIGYACLTVGVPETNSKSCTMKNANATNLEVLIHHNLTALENIIDYNIKNNICLFRISSDLIPFGSSPVNKVPWWDVFTEQLSRLNEKIRSSGMRVSMHPGQYTVLNSPSPEVVSRAVDDLEYHAKALSCLTQDKAHKIVLHIGGVYSDKSQAMERFIDNFKKLDVKIQERIVLENDDKSYTIDEVLEIAKELKLPVIFDNLHHKVNPSKRIKDEVEWINICKETWKEIDGQQKIHYSQQDPLKKSGAHSMTIGIKEFIDFCKRLDRKDIDIMLEVKDKNLSAVKCINTMTATPSLKALELEWSRYKYNILERSPADYLAIRKLLRNKMEYPVVDFYDLIEAAFQKEENIGHQINALQHVWGYFKDISTDKEKALFLNQIKDYQEGTIHLNKIKSTLYKLALKYQEAYLLNGYYFIL